MSGEYWSKFVGTLEPYVPGEQPRERSLVKLNTNENPYGPSPAVLAAIQAAATDQLRLYPPPDGDALTAVIADYYGLQPEQVFLGNGSDEVLAHTFNALLRHSLPVLFADVTYSFYPVYCGLYDIAYVQVPLDAGLGLRVADYQQPNGGIVLANPNAPTGRALPLAEIEALLGANQNSVVVIDEAYIDFGGETAASLVDTFANLLVIQTVSKSRSLAGLRLGFAMGNANLIAALNRVKNSFNSYPLGQLALAGGLAAFADEDYFVDICARIVETRSVLTIGLETLGFEVLPSAANFVFTRHPDYPGATLAARLRTKNILVRHFKQPRIADYLRITVGTAEQTQLLLSAFANIVK